MPISQSTQSCLHNPLYAKLERSPQATSTEGKLKSLYVQPISLIQINLEKYKLT